MPHGNKHVDRRSVLKTVGAGATVGMMGLSGCLGEDNGDGEIEGSSDDAAEEGVSWTIGTSGEETATHASGVAFSSIVTDNSDMIEMSAQTTGGTTANNRLIDEREIDIGQTTTDLLWRASHGNPPYDDPPIDLTLCQTFSYMSLDVFLVKRDIDELEDVTTASDLDPDMGLDISFGPRGTSAYDLALDGLSVLGIDGEEFDPQSMGLGDQAGAMNDGRIDVCVVYTANQQTLIGWIQQLDAQVEIDVLNWEISDEMAEESDTPVSMTEVDADVWNQDISHDPFDAIPMAYTTVIPAAVQSDVVYEYVDVLMENADEVNNAHEVLSSHGPEYGVEWLERDGVPVHPGAQEWFEENDLWDDDLTTVDEYEG
ncbi:TAXI family TRAP transporter solute-binding subunit [Natronorubrum sp. FCH18a]|uniref:TAXI family TRAP transporter solute-binding subunit n=1 Tax=Natronorubrum sp. FCH18a TaxID=3447018 RepID=UPI003F516E9E